MPARIVVLAGVNGAGKSSIGGEALRQNGGDFFNPDAAAHTLLSHNPGMSQEAANGHAWEFGRLALERALAQGGFFALETTLGANTIPDMLLTGAKQGAQVHIWYAGLASPELHLARVRSRVQSGGHDIPEPKIRERYVSSRANLIRLLPWLASLHLYDNSVENDPKAGCAPTPLLLLHMQAGKIVLHSPLAKIPQWAKPVLAAAFESVKT